MLLCCAGIALTTLFELSGGVVVDGIDMSRNLLPEKGRTCPSTSGTGKVHCKLTSDSVTVSGNLNQCLPFIVSYCKSSFSQNIMHFLLFFPIIFFF